PPDRCRWKKKAAGIDSRRPFLSLLQSLADRLARLRVKRPEITDAAPCEPFLENGHVRVPAGAEILCAGAAGDAAVSQDEARLPALRHQLVSDGPVLAALERRLEQAR